jgi:hypothetical protein
MLCHRILTNRQVSGIRPYLNDKGEFGVKVGTVEDAEHPSVFVPLSTEYQRALSALPAWALDQLPQPEHLDVPDEPFASPVRLINERSPNENDGYALVLVQVRPGWAAGVNGMRGRPVPVEYQAVPFPVPQPFPPPGVRCIRGGLEPEALFEMAPGSRVRIVRQGFVGGGWGIMDIKNEGNRLRFFFPERQKQVA